MKRRIETAQRVYPTAIGKIRRALLDAGFISKGAWDYSKGTEYGCLRAIVKGRKKRTRIRVKHELNKGEKIPDHLLTNDVYAEQALIDIERLLSGAYTPQEVAKMSAAVIAKQEAKEKSGKVAKFDKKMGYEVVMLGISVAIDEGTKVKGGRYVSEAMIFRPNEVKRALEKSEGMDEYFAILADGKSSQEDMERAAEVVVPYLQKELKKKKKKRRSTTISL